MTNASPRNTSLHRRRFLIGAAATAAGLALPTAAAARVRSLAQPVRIGLITDLHQDIMHDGLERMEAFLEWSEDAEADCVMQLGDFAYPNNKNSAVIDRFNGAGGLHVIGNHDMDAGHTKEQCLDVWGMSGRFYAHDIGGLRLLVLDGNDVGSPTHGGGYVKFVGEEQQEWLAEELESHTGPCIVFSHQPLAGPDCVDNAKELQALLSRHAAKVVAAVNGHTHIDLVQRIDRVHYIHINSASYQWVGGKHKHESYPAEIHAAHPWIAYTSPYEDSLFAGLTVDPETGTITIEGRESAWVGPSPAELGADVNSALTHGEEIAPRIRSRRIERVRDSH